MVDNLLSVHVPIDPVVTGLIKVDQHCVRRSRSPPHRIHSNAFSKPVHPWEPRHLFVNSITIAVFAAVDLRTTSSTRPEGRPAIDLHHGALRARRVATLYKGLLFFWRKPFGN